MDAFLAAEAPSFSSTASSSARPTPPWRQQRQQEPLEVEQEEPQEFLPPHMEQEQQEEEHLLKFSPKFLPKRKVKEAWSRHTQPKMRAKPPDTADTKRAVSSRSPAERKRLRATSGEEARDDREMPWDARGPPGPQEGGPKLWMKQKYRANTGRWANAGGRHREKYQLWRQKAAEGLKGKELAFYHPMTKGGYWEQECNRLGIMCPRLEKEI